MTTAKVRPSPLRAGPREGLARWRFRERTSGSSQFTDFGSVVYAFGCGAAHEFWTGRGARSARLGQLFGTSGGERFDRGFATYRAGSGWWRGGARRCRVGGLNACACRADWSRRPARQKHPFQDTDEHKGRADRQDGPRPVISLIASRGSRLAGSEGISPRSRSRRGSL